MASTFDIDIADIAVADTAVVHVVRGASWQQLAGKPQAEVMVSSLGLGFSSNGCYPVHYRLGFQRGFNSENKMHMSTRRCHRVCASYFSAVFY